MATRPQITIAFDDLADVVSAYVTGTKAAEYAPAPTDHRMMIERDRSGNVVGIELLGASAISRMFWEHHPDRQVVPVDILAELDSWLAQRWASIGRT